MGSQSPRGRRSSLPDCGPVPNSLLSTSQNQLPEAGHGGPAQASGHCGRPSAGRVGQRQKGPSLCSPACPWPHKRTVPRHTSQVCARAHTRTRTRANTHTHTHTHPHSLLSIWHTGDTRGLQQRRWVASWPQPSMALGSENASARGNLRPSGKMGRGDEMGTLPITVSTNTL